jgi:hypothetical protein
MANTMAVSDGYAVKPPSFFAHPRTTSPRRRLVVLVLPPHLFLRTARHAHRRRDAAEFFFFIHGRDRLMVGQTEEEKCHTSRTDPVTPN